MAQLLGTTINGNLTVNGTAGINKKLTVESEGADIKGGVTVSSGNLNVSSGNLTVSGTATITGILSANNGNLISNDNGTTMFVGFIEICSFFEILSCLEPAHPR